MSLERDAVGHCDCRVWRKALAPLMEAVRKTHQSARAAASVDGVKMRRVPADTIHELRAVYFDASEMFIVDGHTS